MKNQGLLIRETIFVARLTIRYEIGGRFDGREGEGLEYGRCHSEMRLKDIHNCASGFDAEGGVTWNFVDILEAAFCIVRVVDSQQRAECSLIVVSLLLVTALYVTRTIGWCEIRHRNV